MYMNPRNLFICFVISLFISGISNASEYVVDQRNDNDGGVPSFEGYTTALTIIGQSFSPTANTLDHVELYVRAASLGFSSEVHIDIMDSPTGIVLGSSGSQIIDDQFIVRHFHLDSIDISGYSTLFLRLVEDFGTLTTQVHASLFLTSGVYGNDYAGGSAYANVFTGGDFWFRTGASTTHADTAEYATTAGHATTAGTAANLSSDLCENGELLVKENDDWMCTDTAPNATSAGHSATAGSATTAGHSTTAGSATTSGHATTADSATTAGHSTTADSATTAGTATTAESLSNNICGEGEILIKENSAWVCASRNTASGTEYADVAGTLDPDLCGAGEVLKKGSNNEWSCSIIAQGTPFFTSGVAVQGQSVYNAPNSGSPCCFLPYDKELAEVVLPRGGALSNLTVKPVRIYDELGDEPILEVALLINGIESDLIITHDNNVDTGAVINTLDRVEVLPTDSISIRFTETGGTCLGYERLDFMEDGVEILEEAVIDIMPLVLKYDRHLDPPWWKDSQEQDALAENLRYIYSTLSNGPANYYDYCGRYSVSFLLE